MLFKEWHIIQLCPGPNMNSDGPAMQLDRFYTDERWDKSRPITLSYYRTKFIYTQFDPILDSVKTRRQ